jgi:iron complex outermembrane receptor protein
MAPQRKALTGLLLTVATLPLLLGASAAQTPSASPPAPDQDPAAVSGEASDEVVVTGSRIASKPLNAPQPIQIVGAEVFKLQGTVDTVNLLDTIPALQTSTSSAQADGAAPTLNLRGLGIDRTLVLVDGKRHVAGVPGSAAVDISTIPSALIERVEVLTGGASAVYGSDAVTGVVNFIMKKDFEGAVADFQGGISSEGDGLEYFHSGVVGANFGEEDRGNVTFAYQISHTEVVFFGDRDFTANNLRANDYSNPALRFQPTDPIPAGQTFETVVGRTILLGNGSPRFANTAASLITRAQTSTSRAFIADPRFSISSTSGIIGLAPVGFGGFAGGDGDFLSLQDTNNNGRDDCSESFGGRYGPGFSPGCWIVDNTGTVRPFRDGLQAGSSNQSGGDGAGETFNGDNLTPENDSIAAEISGRYKFADLFQPYFSAKFVKNRGRTWAPYNSFDDTIIITLDNPFIPQEIRDLIAQEELAGNPIENVTIARDNVDIFDPIGDDERQTYRFVLGSEGEFDNGWTYDVSLNYGRTEGTQSAALRLEDRYFAAIDAVDDGFGNIVCRSTLDPNANPIRSLLYDDPFTPVPFTTFTPGANSGCVPLNLFGEGAPSAEARAFQRYIAKDSYDIDQFVVNATLVGDSAEWFELPGGPIGFAVGTEYRRETSDFRPDPFKEAGYGFQFTTTASVTGEYDVLEAFAEINLPILSDVPFAKILSVNLAGRISNYSTVGNAETWKVDAIWAPVDDIRFRGGYSVAVRAPNIAELFSPLQSAVFRPIDPCDANEINNGPNPANRAANCAADGIPVGFVDPLTARFVGQTGGNESLEAETAKTWTVGAVFTPTFLPGFNATVDYWNISIENAISAVSDQNIVDACYDAPSLANQFCALFTRNRNPASPTFLGFNYLLQTQVNFAKLEAAGVDFNVRYRFDLADAGLGEIGDVTLGVSGTWTEKRNNFEVVTDPNEVNPELSEISLPKWAFNTLVQWDYKDWTVSFYSNYQSKQALTAVEIENAGNFTPAFADAFWVHNASVQWRYSETLDFTLGVQNITNEEPFLGSVATPVSGIGRYFFLRASTQF